MKELIISNTICPAKCPEYFCSHRDRINHATSSNNWYKVSAAASLLILLLITSCNSATPKTYDFDIPRASQTYLSPTFQGKWEQHSTTQIDSGMQLAASVAVETLHVGFEWGQVEKQSGDFDWSVTDSLIGVGGVRTSVLVNMLDASLPADVSEAYFGTPEYTGRFSQMLQAFLQRYQDSIAIGDGARWIWNLRDKHFPASLTLADQVVHSLQLAAAQQGADSPQAEALHTESRAIFRQQSAPHGVSRFARCEVAHQQWHGGEVQSPCHRARNEVESIWGRGHLTCTVGGAER